MQISSDFMKYVELLFVLDLLSKYHPRYYSQELFSIAEDVLKWINNELPEDSSALVYLKKCFGSPANAYKAVSEELDIVGGPFLHPN
jgi:hypothetical protein